MKTFKQSQLQAIAGALRDTDTGVTGSEIGHLLAIVNDFNMPAQLVGRTLPTAPQITVSSLPAARREHPSRCHPRSRIS